MIDPTIQPIGRTLVFMGIGALKYQAVMRQKNIQIFQTQIEQINQLEEDSKFASDLSFDLTSSMIDKRFKASKNFVQSSGSNNQYVFKKSTSKSDRALVHLTQQNAIKTRTRYNNAVSRHNKMIMEKKMQSSYKLINAKNYI